MILSGFVVMVPAILAHAVTFGKFTGYIVLFIGATLGIFGMIGGRYYTGKLVVAVGMMCLPYIFILIQFLLHPTYARAHDWDRQFFIGPLLVYLSPMVLTGLGVRFGMQRSLNVAVWFGVVALCVYFAGYSIGNWKLETRSSSYVSFHLVDNEDAHLEAVVECIFKTNRDDWTFRSYDRTEFGETKINVLSKKAGVSLPLTALWRIDGEEESCEMRPINRPDGFTSLRDSSTFDHIPKWGSKIPFEKIIHSNEVSGRWGTIEIVFGEPQFQAMRSVEETLAILKAQNSIN